MLYVGYFAKSSFVKYIDKQQQATASVVPSVPVMLRCFSLQSCFYFSLTQHCYKRLLCRGCSGHSLLVYGHAHCSVVRGRHSCCTHCVNFSNILYVLSTLKCTSDAVLTTEVILTHHLEYCKS